MGSGGAKRTARRVGRTSLVQGVDGLPLVFLLRQCGLALRPPAPGHEHSMITYATLRHAVPGRSLDSGS